MTIKKKTLTDKQLKKLINATNNGWRVTTPLYQWLSSQGDNSATVPPHMLSVLKKLTATRTVSRSGSFHPSQLHHCEREQVFGFLNVPVKAKVLTPETQNLFNDGTWRHIRWQLMLLQAGIVTDVEVPVRVPGYRLTGSMDAINDAEHWMLELKGTSQFQQVALYGAMPQHIRQVHGYLCGRPDLQEVVILYEDKSTNHWHEVIVPRRRTLIKEVEGILSELNEAIDHKKLPPVLPECQRGEGQYRTCPFAYACKQVSYAEAEAAAGCADHEEVYVKLGINRRNTHQTGTRGARTEPAPSAPRPRNANLVRSKGGAIRVR